MRAARRAARVLGVIAAFVCFFAAAPARADGQPPGWKSPEVRAEGAADSPKGRSTEAYDAAQAAEAARSAGLWDQCIDKDTESIAAEDRPTTRVHLAGCAEKAGKLLVALRHIQVVLDGAIAAHDTAVADLARKRTEQLLRRLATITITAPVEAKDVTVTIDDAAVPAERVGKPIAVDPGQHRVHAEGVLDGAPAYFEEVASLGDGEHTTIAIALRPRASEYLTPGQLACMQLAKTQEEVLACLPGAAKPLVARAALELSGYADTFSVMVLNPSVHVNVASPTNGWSIGGSYLVDMISAASPDFVSTASPRGHDLRQVGEIDASYKPGRFGFDALASYSTEADYVSRAGTLGVLGDFFEKRATVRASWMYANDTISRGGTPPSVFSNTLQTHEGTASLSLVLSPTSLLVAGLTAGFERGDQSKPYRLIPMFADGVEVGKGASPDEVNAKRLPVRPYEQLPLDRDRYALGLRLAQRFKTATLRLEERLYDDTWEIRASSTDARWLQDVGTRFTFGPHVRFHAQTGADFYQRIYHAELTPLVAVPVFRTTDRELGPMWAVTGGASFWWHVSAEHASPAFTIYFSGDALSSHYLNSLYVTERLAGYGTIGVEAQFE
jgi:hypothetical protein